LSTVVVPAGEAHNGHMFLSLRHTQLIIRIGLGLVFLWLGINKFIMPQYWIDTWLTPGIQHMAYVVHLAPRDLLFLIGACEILTAISLVSGFFFRIFASAAVAALVAGLLLHGLNETTIRDIGLIGALVALIVWPERTYL
jgi:uncharacterized membrane protein YphA (DoxX/SURF4 family)